MSSFFFNIGLDLVPGAAKSTLETSFSTFPVVADTGQVTATGYPDIAVRQCRARSKTDDWRYGLLSLQSIDMMPASDQGGVGNQTASSASLHKSLGVTSGLQSTRARFEPSAVTENNIGWGVVRLYRDAEETPGLYDNVEQTRVSRHKPISNTADSMQKAAFRDEDCTTLCILAVPSYMTPSDFLGWIGEKTREEVSHFRMIRTERANRFMVLLRFRNGRAARQWRKEWNGASFTDTESETCHVVFVKSVEFRIPETEGDGSSFPDTRNDPFTSSSDKSPAKAQAPVSSSAALKAKPFAPPTPSLIELPTCPVCLERMDESTGLLTILCQHVFHCSCLSKWRGSGCPVCRFTHDDLSSKRPHPRNSTEPDTGPNECATCRSDTNLWICLICGNVGCGRYDAAHAFLHYQQTSHCFAMDMTTQRVWDYASDAYVHRIVQNKLDGKLMELPAASSDESVREDETAHEDYVPKIKLDAIGREYTTLLTSQLESQRLYFEEKIAQSADKASQASAAATTAAEAASRALSELSILQASHIELKDHTLSGLEKDLERTVKRADRFEEMARKLEKQWREEKAISGGLMERLTLLDGQVQELKGKNQDLEEMNRDMSFFISSQEKLKDMGEDVIEGTVSVPESQKKGRKGKGKGKTAS